MSPLPSACETTFRRRTVLCPLLGLPMCCRLKVAIKIPPVAQLQLSLLSMVLERSAKGAEWVRHLAAYIPRQLATNCEGQADFPACIGQGHPSSHWHSWVASRLWFSSRPCPARSGQYLRWPFPGHLGRTAHSPSAGPPSPHLSRKGLAKSKSHPCYRQ